MTIFKDTNELFEFIASRARKIYQEKNSHVPMFFLEFTEPMQLPGSDEELPFAIIIVKWTSERDREIASRSMKTMCQTGKIKRIALVHESWMLKLKPGEVDDGTAPSEHPDRISVLWLSLESSDGEKRVGYWTIKDVDTPRAALQQFEEMPSTALGSGRFANFFGERSCQ